MIEEWRQVPGFGAYMVSNRGRLMSRSRQIKGRVDVGGYVTAVLGADDGRRRRCMVHVLVLLAFVGPRPAGFEARHINGRPADNRLENLAWGSRAENMADKARHGTQLRGERSPLAKLTDDAVRLIRAGLREGASVSSLARRFGVSRRAVRFASLGVTWGHVREGAHA